MIWNTYNWRVKNSSPKFIIKHYPELVDDIIYAFNMNEDRHLVKKIIFYDCRSETWYVYDPNSIALATRNGTIAINMIRMKSQPVKAVIVHEIGHLVWFRYTMSQKHEIDRRIKRIQQIPHLSKYLPDSDLCKSRVQEADEFIKVVKNENKCRISGYWKFDADILGIKTKDYASGEALRIAQINAEEWRMLYSIEAHADWYGMKHTDNYTRALDRETFKIISDIITDVVERGTDV